MSKQIRIIVIACLLVCALPLLPCFYSSVRADETVEVDANSKVTQIAATERVARVSIGIDEEGQTNIYLYLTFVPEDSTILENSIASLMNRSLQDVQSGKTEFNPEDEEYEEELPPDQKPTPGWYYNAKCQYNKQDRIIKANFDLNPLMTALRANKAENLTIDIYHPEAGYNQYSAGVNYKTTADRRVIEYELNINDSVPPPFQIEFGNRYQDLARIYGPYPTVLLLPILLILILRSYTLRKIEQDRARAWFNYWLALRAIITICWFGWLAVALTTEFNTMRLLTYLFYLPFYLRWFVQILALIIVYIPVLSSILVIFFYNIPPAIISIVCIYLSYPVYTRARGLTWTRRELVMQSLWSELATILPLAMLVAAIVSMLRVSVMQGLFLLFIAYVSRIFFNKMLQKAQKLAVQKLESGNFYQNILTLAEKAGVKIKEILLLTTGKEQEVNAFAIQGNKIMLTTHLLNQLNRREVDAIIAHELSHLKKKHPTILSTLFIIGLLQPGFFAYRYFPDYANIAILILLTIFSVLYLYLKRRFEYDADQEANLLTNDPEALITALVKISHINLTPLGWSSWQEKFLTHPSTLRRAEVIATAHNIPVDRLAKLISDPTSFDIPVPIVDQPVETVTQVAPQIPAQHYDLSASDGNTPKLFNSNNRQRDSVDSIYQNILLTLTVLGFAMFIFSGWLAMEGGLTRTLLDRFHLPAFLFPIGTTLLSTYLYCAYIRKQLLGAIPGEVKFFRTKSDRYPLLDNARLSDCSKQLEELGFQHIVDFTIEFDVKMIGKSYARLFINPEKHCCAEVYQVFMDNGPAFPMNCTIISYLENGWAFSVTDCKPDASSYVNRIPRNLTLLRPDATPTELFYLHQEKLSKISQDLKCTVLPMDSSDLHFAKQDWDTRQRRQRLVKRSILLLLIEGTLYERNPRTDLIDDYFKNNRNR